MFTKINNLKTNKPIRYLLILNSFLLAFAVLAFSLITKFDHELAEKHLSNQEQTAVLSGANSIEKFFNFFGESLTIFTAREDLSPSRLDSFIESWKETPIAGVIVTDTAGKVVANANRSGQPDLGTDLSDRDYFIWAKEGNGQYFVSNPVLSRLGASKDKYIVVVAARVTKNGQFDGVLAASVIIDELVSKYLDPVKIFPTSRLYLVDNSGTIIVSPWPNLTGLNYFDYLKQNSLVKDADKSLGYLKQAVSNPSKGDFETDLPNEKKGGMTTFLVAYTPIFYNSDYSKWWTLAMATPHDEVDRFATNIYIRLARTIVLTLLIGFITTGLLAKNKKIIENEVDDTKTKV